MYPRSPGTHIGGSWVIDSINLHRDPRTGTQYIGNWASRGVGIYIYIWFRLRIEGLDCSA